MQAQPAQELARALVSQGKLDAAEKVLAAACAIHADHFDLAVARADVASRRHQWQQAEGQWRALLERCPGQLRCVLGLAEALQQLKKFAQAETLLATALLSDPDTQAAAEALARVSAARGEWSEAYRRWSAITRRFPTSIAGWHGVAFARLQQGDLADAEALSSQAVALFPDQAAILTVHAVSAASASNWPEAERRWDRLRKLMPHHADMWVQQARALRGQGRDAAAAALLDEAPPCPGNLRFAMMRAELANTLGHWADACGRWHELSASSPGDRRLQLAAFVSAWRAAGSEQGQLALARLKTAAVPYNEERDLLLRFEGLGNDGEFAHVQRNFGAEPLGLFRWADIAADRLVAALDANLEGIGNIETTRLVTGSDYKVRDRRFGLLMHTWVYEDQVDREQFFRGQCRRLGFLRRNLLDDFHEADKIFVYKSDAADCLEDIRKLHAAIRRHGRATLLHIRLADGERAVGSVEQVDDGLLVGYIDRLHKEGTPISYDCWFKICRTALVQAAFMDAAAAEALSLRDLVLRFESMGDNCEFGCVQRYVKAEPIGLLRWTATNLESITKAIETGLAGIGDAENTELVMGGDFRALDSKFGFRLQTFLLGDYGSAGDLLIEQCERMRFLGRQLLSDLQAAKKIFAHKTATPPSSDDVTSLHAAMKRHGPATLLHVRPSDTCYANGTVRELAPGLLVGHIDRVTAAGDGWGIDYDTWLDVCRKAAAFYGHESGHSAG